MKKSIFNIFNSRKKEPTEEEEIKPPDRRLSISKSGRMKERNRERQSLSIDTFQNHDKTKDKLEYSNTSSNKEKNI
ncbi:hypothetical protein RN001_012010 [Aquatica leii]|uniref:Uncharacterized protein n=1 Tax=Aquatica leii TaxID=1421715 RepID=A0AAN7P4Z2_9COLE|nr:hypothetical protein RN001_012010 [Aquatica leii]